MSGIELPTDAELREMMKRDVGRVGRREPAAEPRQDQDQVDIGQRLRSGNSKGWAEPDDPNERQRDGTRLKTKPPDIPYEGPTARQEFVRPPPQFSPSLFAGVPANDLEFEMWAKQATEEIKAYVAKVDQAYLTHMAAQGQLDLYMQEQLQGTDEADRAARLGIAAEMMQFAGPRTPQLRSQIGMVLQQSAGDPNLAAQLAPLQQQWDVDRLVEEHESRGQKGIVEAFDRSLQPETQQPRSELSELTDMVRGKSRPTSDPDEEALTRTARSLQGRSSLEKYVGHPLDAAAKGTLFQGDTAGPEHRVMQSIVEFSDKKAAALVPELRRLGLSAEDAQTKAESFRTKLLHGGYEEAEKFLRKAGVEEGAIESFLSKTAHFVGFGGGASLASRAGKAALGTVKLAWRMVTGAKAAGAAGAAAAMIEGAATGGVAGAAGRKIVDFMAGSAGIYGWSQAMGPGEAFEPVLAKLEGKERERAREAASMMNGAMAVVMLPMLHYSHLAGRAMTFGVTKGIGNQALRGAVESGIGFQPTAEAANKIVNFVRRGLMDEASSDPKAAKSKLALTLQTFPGLPGHLESMGSALLRVNSAATPQEAVAAAHELREAAKGYAAEFFPNMAGFMAMSALGIMRPGAVDRSMLQQARREVKAVLDPESAKIANRVINEAALEAVQPSAAEKVAEQGESGQKATKTAEAVSSEADRVRRAIEESYLEGTFGADPDTVVAGAVKASGADLTDPKQALALSLALRDATVKRALTEPEPGPGMPKFDPREEAAALNEALERHKLLAVQEAAAAKKKAAEPPKMATDIVDAEGNVKGVKMDLEPMQMAPPVEGPTAEAQARKVRMDAMRATIKAERDAEKRVRQLAEKAANPEEAKALEAEADAREDRVTALERGEEPAPVSRETVERAKAERPARAVRRTLKGAQEKERAAQRVLDSKEELERAATVEEGAAAVDRAVLAEDAAAASPEPRVEAPGRQVDVAGIHRKAWEEAPASASPAARAEAARAELGRHFMEHVQVGDVFMTAQGHLLTVSAKPHVRRGHVKVRMTNAEGKDSPFGMRDLVRLAAKPTPARQKPPKPPKPKEEAPKNPVEAATRARRVKRQERDQKLEEASERTLDAETPAEREAAQREVQEGLVERRKDEAADVLRERLQTGDEIPPQAEPRPGEASTGPTDANNFSIESLRPQQKRNIAILKEIVESGVVRDIRLGREPKKVGNDRGRSFLAFWKSMQHRYQGQKLEEGVAEAMRDYLRHLEDLPPKSETMESIVDRLWKQLQAISALTHPPEAMEKLLKLQRNNESFICGPEGYALRFSPKGVRFLNKMEAEMMRLHAGGSQAGFALVPGVEAWSNLYHTLRTVWPMVHPSWWMGPAGHSPFNAALLDEMTRMFTKDPDAGDKPRFGRIGAFVARWWDASLGSPERWGNRLVAEAAKEMNLIYSKAQDLLHRTVGKNATWRQFLEAEPDRDARVFRAVNKGPNHDNWKALSPEESAIAHEIRNLMRKMWETLEPVTKRGFQLRRALKLTDRAIDFFEGQLKSEADAQTERAMKAAEAGEPVNLSKLGATPKQRSKLRQLHARRKALAEAIEQHREHGGIEEFAHHVIEEHDVSMDSFITTPQGERGMALPGEVVVGAMKRRSGRAEASGRLKESMLASLADYFPQAVAYYHRNSLLQRWADFFHGEERPFTMEDVFAAQADGRGWTHRPIHYNGRDWSLDGFFLVAPDGTLHARQVKNADGEWVTNRNVPNGSRLGVVLRDWQGRRNPWGGEPKPSSESVVSKNQKAAKFMFKDRLRRWKRLEMAAKALGNGKVEAGMDLLWSAYRAGPNSEAFLELPEATRKVFLDHIGYLPPHSGEMVIVSPKTLAAETSVRAGGWLERATPRRKLQMKEYLDEFAGKASELRLSFNSFDGLVARIAKIANASKIGWFNPKTAMTVITGGVFYNAAMPFHPATMMDASQLAFRFLIRWRQVHGSKNAISPADLVPGHTQSPFRAGAKDMRTSPEELAAMTPEARARQEMIDDAFEAAYQNPVFMGKIADMARILTMEESHARTTERMSKWRVGEEVDFGGRRYRVESDVETKGRHLTVKVRQILPDGQAAKKATTLRHRLEEPGTVMQLLMGHRGYELIEGMEYYIRSQSFLAGYMTARRAGRSDKEARLLGENATFYAHGIFNQMTASAFYKSPLGSFLGGIKSYAARQLGVWMRSPGWMRGRYASMALALNSAVNALGLTDLTNALGTSLGDVPLLGPWSDMGVAAWEDTVDEEGDEVQRFAIDNILKPGLLPFHIPVGESPATGLITGAGDVVDDLATGNYGKAVKTTGRSLVGAFEPWFFSAPRKAFMSPETEPGRYSYTPLFGDKVSYKLNQSGFEQLVKSLLVPGTQHEVSQQMADNRMSRARDDISRGTRSNWDQAFEAEARLWAESASAGTLTPTKADDIRGRVKELIEEGRALGKDVTPSGLRALEKRAQENLRIDAMGPAQRNILRASSKLDRVRAFSRAMESGLLTMQEARQVADELRGESSFVKWASDPKHVPQEDLERLERSYKKLEQRKK